MDLGSTPRRIRAVITASTALSAHQLTRDLATDHILDLSTACNVGELFDRITLARPAVVLLDTQLAGENTPQLIQGLVHQRNIAVVLRADGRENPAHLLDCIEQGALSITTKPVSTFSSAELTPSLIWTIRAAAGASISNLIRPSVFPRATGSSSSNIFALGSGIGGLSALGGVLTQLPTDAPGCIAVTDLPAYLTGAWVDRLKARCQASIKQAENGDAIRAGQILVAPGDKHLFVRRGTNGWTVAVKNGPAVFHQRPSLEVLFNSLADSAPSSTIAALFSGTGVDGAAALLGLRKSGARTVAQTPDTAVCSDLLLRAQRCHSIELSLPANEIAQKMLNLAAEMQLSKAA